MDYQANRKQEIARAIKNINKDRVATNTKKRDRCRKNPVSYMLWGVKSRAKTRGIPFNLTQDDIVIPQVCPVLGIQLVMGTGCPSPNSPSLDRIDPNYGYVKGNVQVISHRANTIKSNATVDELRLLLAYMEKQEMPDMSGETVVFAKVSRYLDKNRNTLA